MGMKRPRKEIGEQTLDKLSVGRYASPCSEKRLIKDGLLRRRLDRLPGSQEGFPSGASEAGWEDRWLRKRRIISKRDTAVRGQIRGKADSRSVVKWVTRWCKAVSAHAGEAAGLESFGCWLWG